MRLSKLIKNLDFEALNFKDVEISYLSEDSRDVKEGTLFFCISGFQFDGHDFAEEALKKGAVALLINDREKAKELKKHNIPVIVSKNIRRDLSIVASRFYGNPHRKLKVTGVTGTNGKTTSSYILYSILNTLKRKAGLIGTVEYKTEDWTIEASRTTPSPIALNKLLKRMYNEGTEWVICEVSSHSLSLNRVSGIELSGGIFTNLSPEHLDFHGNLNDYFLSKYKILEIIKKEGIFLTNSDDPYGKLIYGLKGIYHLPIMSYGKRGDFLLKEISQSEKGLEITVKFQNSEFKVGTNLKGEYNAYNLLAAVSILKSFGVKEVENRFWEITVPGRLEEVEKNVFIDYAHTPDALLNVLKNLRKFCKGNLILVFGCGGDRDKGKRKIMGEIAHSLADRVIITNDNPRTESPEKIVSDILKGIDKDSKKVEIILNRKEAIKRGIRLKGNNDILLIAGKGHEPYQEVGNRRIPFSDKEVVREIFGDK